MTSTKAHVRSYKSLYTEEKPSPLQKLKWGVYFGEKKWAIMLIASTPDTMLWEWHFTSVIFLPKTQAQSNHGETSDNSIKGLLQCPDSTLGNSPRSCKKKKKRKTHSITQKETLQFNQKQSLQLWVHTSQIYFAGLIFFEMSFQIFTISCIENEKKKKTQKTHGSLAWTLKVASTRNCYSESDWKLTLVLWISSLSIFIEGET